MFYLLDFIFSVFNVDLVAAKAVPECLNEETLCNYFIGYL